MLSRVDALKKLNQLSERYPNLKFWDTMTKVETTISEYVEKFARLRSEETLNDVLETVQTMSQSEQSFS